MKAKYALVIAAVVGFLFGGIDLLDTLITYNRHLAEVIYYISINFLVVIIAVSLMANVVIHDDNIQKDYKYAFLVTSYFFGIEGYWNLMYGLTAYLVGRLRFPIDLGLGNYVTEQTYLLGISFYIVLSLVLYLIYKWIDTPDYILFP